MSTKEDEKKPKGKVEWVLRCPMCFSNRNDLWLGGTGGLQMRKCLDCGYVGTAFIEVEEKHGPATTSAQYANCGNARNQAPSESS